MTPADTPLLKLEFVSPKREIAQDVREVTVPGVDGIFTVLPGHEPFISVLSVGVLEVRDADGNMVKYYVNGGFAEVLDDRVVILSQDVQRPEEIDLERAESARERAEERLKKREGADVLRAEYALRRALARIQAHRHGRSGQV